MPRSEDPGFIIRVAQVLTYFPGASPDRVEQLVTDKLEKTIQEIPELDFVNSTSRSGVSLVFAQILASETDMRPIWDSPATQGRTRQQGAAGRRDRPLRQR